MATPGDTQTQDTRGCLYLENPQKQDHGLPEEGAHGLALPNPSRAAFLGGVSSGKTCCILNVVAQSHAWRPFDGGIFLMSPNNEAVRAGEYGIIDDITCLDSWPALAYWETKPGRKCLIVDDIGWGLSKRGSPSQFELADRTVGHISSHCSLTIMIAQQTHTMIPPNIRRLLSHLFLFPKRLDLSTVPQIAKTAMMDAKALRTCLSFCDQPHDFVVVENIIVPHRSRVRKNGWQNIHGQI